VPSVLKSDEKILLLGLKPHWEFQSGTNDYVTLFERPDSKHLPGTQTDALLASH
jgi:hypothetical protein